jgi:hypothetical protein
VSSEINRIAETFLREYMTNHASVEFHKVVCPSRRYEIHDSNETAVEFLQQVQSQFVESDRIEVSEPASVIVVRACPRHLPPFLAGTRRNGKLVWTYHSYLANVCSQKEAATISKALEDQGISVFLLPTPETRPWSL